MRSKSEPFRTPRTPCSAHGERSRYGVSQRSSIESWGRFALRAIRGASLLLIVHATAHADDASDLAAKIQNPIGSVISLPFESNFNFENGTEDDTLQYVLTIQPVLPFGIAEHWNLIVRPVVPVISQDEFAQIPNPPIVTKTGDRMFGLGDSTLSFFLAPKEMKSGFVWGLGPVFAIPTATSASLGSQKFSLGPTAVGVYKTGPWLLGTLVGQYWSVAGKSSRSDVSAGYIQPFANYNLPDGWYLATSRLMSVNWKAQSGEKWRVPVGAGIGKVFSIGSQQINTRLAGYYNPVRPALTADWSLQWMLQFLFPK